MTYQHALQYLTDLPDSGTATLPVEALLSHVELPDTPMLTVYLSHDRQASLAARYLRSVLRQAGIPCLHVCYAPDAEARECLILNDAPIPPPVLCPPAHAVRALETKARRDQLTRSPTSDALTFPSDARRAAVLLSCAKAQSVRVLILEGNIHSPDPEAFALLLGRSSAITLVSEGDGDQRAAAATIPRSLEAVSHAFGSSAYRRLSDACAKSGCRLKLIPATTVKRHDLTPGSQLLDGEGLVNCRLRSGSATAASAAALAIEGARFLQRMGLALSDGDIRQGLSATPVPDCCTPISIHPPILTYRAEDACELAGAFRDLAELSEVLPAPLVLYLDPALCPLPTPPPALFDHICTDGAWQESDTSDGSAVLLGGEAFLRRMEISVRQSVKKGKVL